jgi:outer membrane receptor protein involved in Fe transport
LRLQNNTAGITNEYQGALNENVAEVQYDLSWPKNNYFILGGSFVRDWSNQDMYIDDTVSDKNYAGYIQDEYRPLDSLILLAGCRYDSNTDYGGNISPRASLIYSPEENLHFKALYSTAFHAPSLAERHAEVNYGMFIQRGNPDLKPEKIKQSEINAEYTLGKFLKATAGYFYWETQDEIQFNFGEGRYVYLPSMRLLNPALPNSPGLLYSPSIYTATTEGSWTNANSRIGHGLEAEVQVKPLPYTTATLNYANINQYARTPVGMGSWADGVNQLVNAILEVNYQDILFGSFSGHVSYSPQYHSGVTQPDGSTTFISTQNWLKQYDVSIGGQYLGFNLVLSAFNVFETSATWFKDDYIKGQRTLNVTVGYDYKF